MSLKLPEEFKTLVGSLIDDWSAFEAAHQQESPASIRLNPYKVHFTPELEQVPWCERGFYLSERPHYTMDPIFHAGAYYPQEAGSMLLDCVLRQLALNREELKVLDLCAAPGGKSTLILDWLDGNGLLVSNEIIAKRASVLRENLDKWGYANRVVCSSDPKVIERVGPVFDVAVVDAPCSGEGMFRKESDALNMWSMQTVEHCSQRQQRIVENAVKCLKPGGYLIYSTCTYNHRENEDVLTSLIDSFGVESVPLNIPDSWNVASSNYNGIHAARCFPHRTRSEGFFIAVLQLPKNHSAEKRIPRRRKSDESMRKTIAPWLRRPENFSYFEHRDQIFAIPQKVHDFAHYLTDKIHVLTIGLQVGRVIREELIPSEALALSIDLNRSNVQEYKLDESEAINYLSKIDSPINQAQDGLVLCTCLENPLGWAKIVSGKLKNRWPKEWRIINPSEPVSVVAKPS